MVVHDFKYDDLSRIAYNTLRKNQNSYKTCPSFHLINFDDLNRSHRCNPLDPEAMFDITDASESARSILLGLNRDWIRKEGDFFVRSAITLVTSLIWFLRKYKNGMYCTLPHVVELMQIKYKSLFPTLLSEPEIYAYMSSFEAAFESETMPQLEGQMATAKIALAQLSSPQLYWALSKSDFTLDINNPKQPKVLCLANNPQKQHIYGAVLSLFTTRVIKLINRKDQLPCSLVLDEFPTIYMNDIDSLIATARSNKVATCLGLQDFAQLKKQYGPEQASVIFNIVGNIISGQVLGETAKQLSERFGKIVQVKESISVNRNDTSFSRSGQLDYAIPPSKLASLSSGTVAGMVADDPDQPIDLKVFHCKILNDAKKLKSEAKAFSAIPINRQVTQQEIMDNYYQVKVDVKGIINDLAPDYSE